MCGNCNYPFSWSARCFNVPVPPGHPPPQSYNGFFAPMPWPMTAPPPLHGHPFAPPWVHATTFPPGPPAYCTPPPTYAESVATATSDASSDTGSSSDTDSTDSDATTVEPPPKKDKKKSSSSSKPPGTTLPGGLRKGTGLLITGQALNLHIIPGHKVSKRKLIDGTQGRFGFKTFTVQDNATIKELIESLGGGEAASVTQMWECGQGRWRDGAKMEHGGDKAGKRLAELGWSGAGRGEEGKDPVWLYFKDKNRK